MLKIKSIKTKLIGTTLPAFADNGELGRYVEQRLKEEGWPLDTLNVGADCPTLNLEFKTKEVGSVASFSIGKMSAKDIQLQDFEQTSICNKLQLVCIIEHENRVVTSVTVYDFTSQSIQDIFKGAYEKARQQILVDGNLNYYSGNKYAYFERTQRNIDSLCFRIRTTKMDTLKGISKSNFDQLFEVEQ